MNGEVVREWFENLRSLQEFVQTFSSTARDDLYEFSGQTLKDLIGSSGFRQNALSRHCQSRNIGFCRPHTYTNLTKTFRQFLDEISIPVHEVLVYRCFDIARQDLVPPHTGRLAALFRKERVDAVCGSETHRQVLTDRLLPDIPPSFHAGKPDLVLEAVKRGWTFDELCEEIVR